MTARDQAWQHLMQQLNWLERLLLRKGDRIMFNAGFYYGSVNAKESMEDTK